MSASSSCAGTTRASTSGFSNWRKAAELSLGDFVLTGGEIAALAFIDATVRLVPGVINPDSLQDESFQDRRPGLAPLYPPGRVP